MESIKKLRDSTGSGIVDCKKALAENDGDLDSAIKWLREKGILKAQKKQNRETKEGVISFYFCSTSNEFTVCKISCETDFVAKNDDFLSFCKNITNIIHDNSPKEAITKGIYSDIKNLDSNSKSIEQLTTDTIAKIGENIQIENYTSYKTNDYIFLTYLHNKYSDSASKMGSIIGLSADKDITPELKNDLKIIPMQVSAMRPMAIDESKLDASILEGEKEIIKKQIDDLSNPKIDQIISGKLNKFIKENTLLNQALISDPKKTIKQLIEETSKNNDILIKIMIMDLYSI